VRSTFSAKPIRREQDAGGAVAVISTPSDASRTTLAITLEATPTTTAETLQTMTLSVNGAATSTFASRAITLAKRVRFQVFALQVECLGSGTNPAPQRAYLRLRSEPAGATTAASPLQLILSAGCDGGAVKASHREMIEVSDGFDLSGDGDTTFGFTLECPDYVAGTATLRVKATVLAFEY
jgi:hypothetical protein